jgi:nitronate monooxygenase
MLEAERAGAKALVVLMDDWPRNGVEWKVLRRIHEEEAHNCGLIGELLKKAGAEYSHATGEFYAKAIAVKGAKERVAFLVKGLRWAVKRFDNELPRLDKPAKDLFIRMRDSHVRSIAACETLLR